MNDKTDRGAKPERPHPGPASSMRKVPGAKYREYKCSEEVRAPGGVRLGISIVGDYNEAHADSYVADSPGKDGQKTRRKHQLPVRG